MAGRGFPLGALTMKEPWKIDLLTSWDEVLATPFWAQWEAWYTAATHRHVFFSPVLAKVWLDTYLPIRNLRPIYVIARSEAATVFLPLVLWRKNWKNAWQRAIVPLGDSDYDYHDPLVVAGTGSIDWAGFWSAVSSLAARHADVVRIEGLRPYCVPPGEPHIAESDTAPFLDLRGLSSGDAYLLTLKNEVRRDMLRCLRRLEERAVVSYHLFAPSEVEPALAAMAAAIEHHRRRWPSAYKAPRFHERLVKAALPAGVLLFSCLELASAQIAWQLSFLDGPVLRHYMPVHDSSYRAYGPGNILRYREIEYAIQRGLFGFDFLRGAEAYKKGSCPKSVMAGEVL